MGWHTCRAFLIRRWLERWDTTWSFHAAVAHSPPAAVGSGACRQRRVIVIQMRKGAVEQAVRTNSVGAGFFGLLSRRVCSRDGGCTLPS